MCCFAKPVLRVGGTRIFSRKTGTGSQFLVYQMEFESEEPNAMILPLPVRLPSQKDSLKFIDLSGYEEFFDDLDRAFPDIRPMFEIEGLFAIADADLSLDSPLVVHKVGNFIGSFVPSLDDFNRLDPQFVIPKETWLKIPEYRDYGFAVFQLEDRAGKQHPMAFEFESRSDEVFFPTVHIHDGEIHDIESFDHKLFMQHAGLDSVVGKYQNSNVIDRVTKFVRSKDIASRYCNIKESKGILEPDLLIHRVDLSGQMKNVDVMFSPNGDPLVPSLNFRSLTRYWPWTIVLAAFLWFLNRRGRLKQRKTEQTTKNRTNNSILKSNSQPRDTQK
jgi:hypothetical protein